MKKLPNFYILGDVMLGAIIGDIIGSTREFRLIKTHVIQGIANSS
jgi:ADP-ribosylglycohydrolase